MAKDAELKTIISAEDKTQTSLKSAQKNIENFGNATKNSTKSMGNNLTKLNKNMQKTAEHTQKTSNSMNTFKGVMLTAGAVTLAATIKNSVNAYAGLSDELAKNSRQVGISIESFQGLQFAAGIQGVSTETLQTNLEKFSLSMGNVRNSQSAMAKSLKKSNPELLAQLQNAKNNEEAFLLFADAVDQEKDASAKALLASKLLGKSGAEMTKFFTGGSASIKGLMDEQLSYGVISEKNAVQCENFNDAMARITAAGTGLKNVVIGALIPGITKLATNTANFLKKNQKLINMFGKMMSAIIPWLPAIIGVVGGFKLLQKGVGGFRTALKTTQIIMPILQKGMKSLALGQKLFNLLTAANPIGLVVLGVVAVVALFAILYIKCKKFRDMINNIGMRIKEFFQPIVNAIADKFNSMVAFGKNLMSMLPWGKNKGQEALEAPEPVSTPLSQQEQENKLEQEHYENKSKTSIDVNFNNLPKGVVVNQSKPAIGVSLNLGYSGG